ncbi:ABC transporter B family member 9 [Hibiscus syriacus]|uniref:ABC transporter B family member 9 n=1 Tax=Hibiscus syriacus TaxID=106335 RepID=A0A6A2YB25_HIBSY|nr:ABC transporter B family member 9 [Hibiscus syriacus]
MVEVNIDDDGSSSVVRSDGAANNSGGNKKKKSADQQKVPFYKLFGFADRLDVAGKFIYLGIYSCITSFTQVTCWMVAGERQAARIRALYLKTILLQDIGFFDTKTSTGEVVGRMSGDTILIQEAMGENGDLYSPIAGRQVLQATLGRSPCTPVLGWEVYTASNNFHWGVYIIAFIKGWQLAIVLTACITLVVLAGGTMAMIMAKMSSRGQIAYAEAGNLVEQTVGSIRTVASFTGEKHAIEKYNDKLRIAYSATVRQRLVSGTGFGTMLLVLFSTYGLSVWVGAKLIANNGYNGGQVINVILAIMTGGIVNAFASGQAAAYKMFETIERKPMIDPYETSGITLEDIRGEIELKDVYFRYPAKPDLQIFAGFSLHVPSGTTATLVGQSGSGKSVGS